MPIKFKDFQIDDLARVAMRDGAILSWDTGLGKSIAAFSVPLIRRARRCLLVAPESLHLQLRETGRDKFGVTVLPLMSKEDFYDWGLDSNADAHHGKTLFFLTTYQALGHNEADEWQADKDDDGLPVEIPTLEARRVALLAANGHPTKTRLHYEHTFVGVGHEKNEIRCVWSPTLARLIRIHDSFDSVVVDEGVRLQSNDAHIATGVRTLAPRHRLVLSATPIKNRLDSLFWLAWWAAGGVAEASPRWPYAGTAEARDQFARQHLQTDRYLTREKEKLAGQGALPNKKRSNISRVSARITNLNRLWKIVAPVVLRRRKADCGEAIVPKTTHYVSVHPGKEQSMIYQHYLHHPPKCASSLAAAGAQLTLLRQAAVIPCTDMMRREGTVGGHVLNPKMWAILSLIADALERGEQMVVGSNFSEFGTALQKLLKDSGVWSCLLDGRVNASKRGKEAREFKDRRHSVMIAGVQAMGEGHSFDRCPNLILPSLDWAFDINSQFVDRVWRMTSSKPVNVYVLSTEGTVDNYLVQLFKEKEESSMLALDGALHAQDTDEASVEALLEKAIKGYKDMQSVDEQSLLDQWGDMSSRLRAAQRKFSTLA